MQRFGLQPRYKSGSRTFWISNCMLFSKALLSKYSLLPGILFSCISWQLDSYFSCSLIRWCRNNVLFTFVLVLNPAFFLFPLYSWVLSSSISWTSLTHTQLWLQRAGCEPFFWLTVMVKYCGADLGEASCLSLEEPCSSVTCCLGCSVHANN